MIFPGEKVVEMIRSSIDIWPTGHAQKPIYCVESYEVMQTDIIEQTYLWLALDVRPSRRICP